MTIAPEFTYCAYALAAASIGFFNVKQNVNYAFYFFVMTRAASKDGNNRFLESRNEGKRFSFSTLIKLLYANFLAPILVLLLFMHELTGSLVVDTLGVWDIHWQVFRLLAVLGVVALRFLLFREELQFQFDQSYYIISRMITEEVEKSENTFLYVRSRVTQNFRDTWFTIFQQATIFMVPVLIVICALHRIVMFAGLDRRAMEFDFSATIQKLRDVQSGAIVPEEGAAPYDLI